jgi:hypothetical protein
LQQIQSELGEDEIVCLYYHVSDIYETPETVNRANYFSVSGIPEVDFDATVERIGAGTNAYSVYMPIVQNQLGIDTPITISTTGVIYPYDDPDPSWVDATFKAVDTIPASYGTLTAQFVVIERIGDAYPWTVRDMLPTESISSLNAPGDSVVIHKTFTVGSGWDLNELQLAVFLEDTTPPLIINAQLMPDPFSSKFVDTDHTASSIDLMGEAVYHTTLTNTGVMRDTLTLDIANVELPGGVGAYDWVAFYCDTSGACHFGPWDYVLEPAESETFDVHLLDSVGTTRGMAVSELTATSKGDPASTSTISFTTFVDAPSILLVDDDGGASFESFLQNAVTDTGYLYQDWDTSVQGRPNGVDINSYWAVLWTTANAGGLGIDVDDENKLIDYLDNGGNLMLASMNYLSGRVDTTAFITDYLHIDSWADDNGGFLMTGVASDPISDGMALSLFGGAFQPSGSDAPIISSPAEVIFTAPPGNKGIKVAENDHKAVFLSFPFECVKTDAADPNNQKTLIGRILSWFETPAGVGDGAEIHRTALAQNYPNPFNPTTKIAFTVPDNPGRVRLTVHNVNGQVVRTLVDNTMPAGPAVVVWDGTDDSGRAVSSGVYFARLAAGEESAFRKMTLLK